MHLSVTRTSPQDQDRVDVAYWLTRSPQERIAAVEELRRRVFGEVDDAAGPRLQRVHRFVNKQASDRPQDRVDVDRLLGDTEA